MMPDFGFPAQPRQASIKTLVAGLRERSDDARVASVTERFADVTNELDGRVSELMQIEKSIRDLQGYSEAIALSEGRASTSQQALEQIRESAQEISDTTDILRTNGTIRDFETLSIQATGQLQSIVANLNSSFAGRNLFAGDAVQTSPIADTDTIIASVLPFLEAATTAPNGYDALRDEFLNAGATFETSIYLGGADEAPVTEVGVGERVDYSVKADQTGIREVLFNMSVMAVAFDQSNAIDPAVREGLLTRASDGLRSSIGAVTQIQSDLGTAEARIATVKSRNIASEASLTITYNDLAGADAFEAALSLRELENQLEIAFSTTSRLANLSLSNFR